ncbi:spermidine synthase [Corynebacterium capitovis DSM 44611]|uniref:spermidine synthase n=1 Tax=Corynebacterium capitovis TaxID=131081 RepID=UPI00035C14F8|nr:fused MFS/spermidine synthase [Corynebacterium capitovis]WKD57819.1 spermidine synthase [Corynebacterium capitovis DSM 44611]
MASQSESFEIETGTAELVDEPDGSQLLLVNGVPSSHVTPGDPLRLEFPYMRWIAHYLDHYVNHYPGWDRPRLTHLGGGACSLPRYFARAWPSSRNTVVEIDAQLARLARELFDVPRAPAVKIRVGDARQETERFKPATRDVIIRDVFSAAATPQELTTVEFYRAAQASLGARGVYLANCGTLAGPAEMREELAGMWEVWPHVGAIGDAATLRGRTPGNVVLIGAPFPVEEDPQLSRALLAGAAPAQLMGERWTRQQASVPRRDPAPGAPGTP